MSLIVIMTLEGREYILCYDKGCTMKCLVCIFFFTDNREKSFESSGFFRYMPHDTFIGITWCQMTCPNVRDKTQTNNVYKFYLNVLLNKVKQIYVDTVLKNKIMSVLSLGFIDFIAVEVEYDRLVYKFWYLPFLLLYIFHYL